MVYALIAALAAVTIAHIWLLDRKDKRERAERATLLVHIQAPQVAVAEHYAATITAPAVEPEAFPMTDAQMAQAQERDRLIEWMEAVENGDELVEEGVPE